MKLNLDLDKSISLNSIVDESYTDTGSDTFNLVHDYFYGSTELEIWTGLLGTGTQLIEDTDYTLSGVNRPLSNRALESIYKEVTIDNATYQTGNLYITYHVCADIIDAGDNYERLEFDTATDVAYSMGYSDPDIIAIDTTTAAFTLDLPDLTNNLGRIITLININGANNITYERIGSDVIGSASATSGTVGEGETEIIVATENYWSLSTNTSHSLGDGSDHADVATNTTHSIGDGSDHADVATNTAASHAESHSVASHNDTTATGTELETLTDGSDSDSLHAHAVNDTHVAGDGSDHADVATNTTHISSDGKNHSDVVLNNGLRVWSSTRTYAEGDATFYDGDMYFSLQAANTNKQPDTETTWWAAFVGGGGGGGLEIGTIFAHGGTVAPIGSEACDGGALSRTDFNELFAAIGTTWGVGDGSTTFNKPDLRGAGLRGAGSHGAETMANGNPYAGPAVGDFEDDQMFGHKHSVDPPTHRHSVTLWNSGAGSLAQDYTFKGATSQTGYTNYHDQAAFDSEVPKTDGTYGTPRTGDETRMFAAGVLICIKATPATASGPPFPTYSYDTGWVANSDWTDKLFTIAHGLDAPLDDLIVKFFIAESADGSDAFEMIDSAFDVSSAANRSRGLHLEASSNSQFLARTAANGIHYFTAAAGLPSLLSSQSWYYKFKVYRPEVLASEIETTKYATAWTAKSDFTNTDIVVTHNLGETLDNLIVKFFLSTSADGSTPEEFQLSADFAGAGLDYGLHMNEINSNSVNIQTGADGIIKLSTIGAAVAINTGTTYYYRVVVYKPEMIASVSTAEFRTITTDYTITDDDANIFSLTAGATARTVTLPLLANGSPGDEKELVKADAGAGKGILSAHATDANKIDGTSAVDIDSQYNRVRVRHMGTWWKVIAYEDHGSNADGEWRREADGTLVCLVPRLVTSISLALQTGSIGNFRNAGGSWTGNWPAGFLSGTVPEVVATGDTVGMSSITVLAGTTTATVWSLLAWAGSSQGAGTRQADIRGEGRWRT